MKSFQNKPHGFVLLMTIVVLVVLSVIVYTLTLRLSYYRQRQQYTIDYQKARYACDSAMKYALATIEELKIKPIVRKDGPPYDFSDLFWMDQDEYEQNLEAWSQLLAEKQALEEEEQEKQQSTANTQNTSLQNDPALSKDSLGLLSDLLNTSDLNIDTNDFAMDANSLDSLFSMSDANSLEPNEMIIPGPYGPAWPYVTEPIEIDIDDVKITIEITDENAKMPLTWAISADKEIQREAKAAIETFFEWMQMTSVEIEDLQNQLEWVAEEKTFNIELKPIKKVERVKEEVKSSRSRRRSRRKRRTRTRMKTTTRPAIAHTTDFAKLLHSGLIDHELLARPLLDTGDRIESAHKYLALWGSQRVNVNSAPRHVLEAAFTFGGDPVNIAEAIILERKEKPFKNMDDLEKRLYQHSTSIERAAPYITTESKYLTLQVTAKSGNAKARLIATAIKEGKKTEIISVMSY